MQSLLALEQIDAMFESVQFKHLSTSDPERLPGGMLPCALAHVKMQDIAVGARFARPYRYRRLMVANGYS